jgi:hypothetical protein
MKKNVGFLDRAIRFILVIILAYFIYKGGYETFKAGILLYIVTGFILVTVITGSCPLYKITKTNTNKKLQHKKPD